MVLGQEILAGNFGIVEPVRGEGGAGAGHGRAIPVLQRMAWRIRVRQDGEMILVVRFDDMEDYNDYNVQNNVQTGDNANNNNANNNTDVP